MPFCANCGKEIEPTAKFCSNCATPIGGSRAPTIASIPTGGGSMTQVYCPNCKQLVTPKKGKTDLVAGLLTGPIGWVVAPIHYLSKTKRCPSCNTPLE
ncbi:MAG: zinc-ribbon domain-containing protein [Candidatus Bathyarchaeia archaeon]